MPYYYAFLNMVLRPYFHKNYDIIIIIIIT